MNMKYIKELNSLILDYEKNVINESLKKLDESDLEILFYEDKYDFLDDIKIKYIFSNRNKIIDMLNKTFDDKEIIIDLKNIKKYTSSNNTYNIIYKFLFDNNYKFIESTNNVESDIVSSYFNDLSFYPRLSKEEQEKCLKENDRYLKLINESKNKIISHYYNLIDSIAKENSETDEEYKYQFRYLINNIIKSIEDKNFNYNDEELKEILNMKSKKFIISFRCRIIDSNTLNFNDINSYMNNIETNYVNVMDEYKNILNLEKERIKIKQYIVEHNLKLVISIAKYYTNRGLPFVDLIQEGNIGLMKALDKYDMTKSSYSTYATWWIKQSIIRALTDKSRPIRLPVHFDENLKKYSLFLNQYISKYDRNPTDDEIIKKLNISKNDLDIYKYYLYNSSVSLNEVIGEEEHGVSTELGDFLVDEKTNVEDDAIKNKIKIDMLNMLDKKLTNQQKAIVLLRYGIITEKPFIVRYRNLIILVTSDLVDEKDINNYLINIGYANIISQKDSKNYIFKVVNLDGIPKTLEFVGNIFGFTRERARQVETNSLKILRYSPDKNKLNYFDN